MTTPDEKLIQRTEPAWVRHAKLLATAAVLITACATSLAAGETAFGTPLRPFAKDSPWNIKPVDPKFAAASVPKSQYFPAIVDGKYSVGVFVASADDAPETIYMREGSKGILIADEEVHKPSIVIPHWPRRTFPADGSDGHADIVDPVTGIIHSLFQLKMQDGKWRASLYTWARLDGRGWGDPARFYQGARAVGVPAMAGLIRSHEVNDGAPIYPHALALSLTFNGLSPNPAYVFPATSADAGAAKTNSGAIPQGALLMLPPGYDTDRIKDEGIRKIAQTLKVYGGYVVDRNHGTPFAVYAEIGSGVRPAGQPWNAAVAAELERMRGELRMVESTAGWLDADGRAVQPEKNLNLLSMRGPWSALNGAQAGSFDMFAQRLVFDRPSSAVVQVNRSTRSMHPVDWALPRAGEEFAYSVEAFGDAKLGLKLRGAAGEVLKDSGWLANGETFRFVWPDGGVRVELSAQSGPPHTVSWVTGKLLRATGGKDPKRPQ